MILRLSRAAALAGVLAAAHTAAAHAQTRPLPTRAPGQACTTVPDSVRGPTPGQIAERGKLRGRLVEIGRSNGVTAPQGLLLVDVDSTRKGSLLFMDSNYPAAGVTQVTRAVQEYMQSLPAGRGYQALIRVDGEYPAISPGHQHCTPVLLNSQTQTTLTEEAIARHPDHGKLAEPVWRRVVVLLVSNREGGISFAQTVRSSGDEYLDRAAEEIGRKLRFAPATLDGVPFDARFRFTLGFEIQ